LTCGPRHDSMSWLLSYHSVQARSFGCVGVCRTKHRDRRDTWSTAVFRSPTSPVDTRQHLRVDVTWLYPGV